MKSEKRSFSIVINNYNYGRFLADAVDSALNQTLPSDEVIVVDDGSTDESRTVIAGYGKRIHPILQQNRGQRSAYNAGFAASTGDLVLFLDSDDVLDPSVVERVLAHADHGTAKVHFPLRIVNREGIETGGTVPSEGLVSGDLSVNLLRDGYYSAPPSSGNVYARHVLTQILPMGEDLRYNADTYTGYLAPFFGDVVAIPEALGSYRLHGSNHDLAGFTNEATLTNALRGDIERICFLETMAAKRGLRFNSDCLKREVHHMKLRISALRIAPSRHLFQGDSRLSLFVQGIRATWSTRYLSVARKLLFSAWFAALAVAPHSLVQKLAAIGCSPAARSSSMSWLLSKTKG